MKNALRLLFIAAFALLLAPQELWAKDGAKQPPARPNAMKVIEGRKELSKFADFISDAGLEKMFEGKDKIVTVFAPSNDAFGKAPSEVLKKAKSDKTHLQSFVKYHVISGSQVSKSDISGRKAGPGAASGETIMFDGTGKTIKVNDAEFVTPDLAASNGVVHVVSKVMTPPSFTEKKEEAAKEIPEPKEPEPVMDKTKAEPVKPGAAPSAVPAGETAAPVKQPESGKGIKGWLKKFGW